MPNAEPETRLPQLNWTTDEAIYVLGVTSRDALKRLRDNHGLPFIDAGGKEFVYPVAEVKAWNAARIKAKPVRPRAARHGQPLTLVARTGGGRAAPVGGGIRLKPGRRVAA